MSCEEFMANFTKATRPENDTASSGQTAFNSVNYYFYTIGLPIVCAFGIFGNVLNLIVLTRKQLQKSMDRMEKSAHLGLLALAVVDMLFCTIALPTSFLRRSFMYTSLDSFALVYFEMYQLSLLNVFLFCSNWLTVVMASARYLAICHPLHARGFIGLRGTRIGIAVVFIASVLLNIPQFFHFKLTPTQCAANCICYPKIKSSLFTHYNFEFAYKVTWAILGTFIPIVILAFCNCCLIRALRQSLKMQRLYRANNPPRDSGHRITPTLIAIVVLFILLACPSEFLKFTEMMVLRSGDAQVSHYHIYQSATIITNFMQACNFAINFVLYCVINVHFRDTITYALCCKWRHKQSSAYVKASTTGQTYVTDMETEM
jgi:hypothetical protein